MRPLHTVQPGTPLTTALSMLLEAGVSVLPVVDGVSATLQAFLFLYGGYAMGLFSCNA